jgi:hypothetical protein
MAQVKNECGDIKCIDEKGNVKWFSPYMIMEASALKMYGFRVVDALEPLLPIIKPEDKTITPTVQDKTEQESFKNLADDSEKSIDEYTKKEIMDELKSLNIKFNVLDPKDKLYTLLKINK